jgi:hypothetical protein
MPWRMPNTLVISSCLRASLTKPTSDWLITTVGPPLWPITAAPRRVVLAFFGADILLASLRCFFAGDGGWLMIDTRSDFRLS